MGEANKKLRRKKQWLGQVGHTREANKSNWKNNIVQQNCLFIIKPLLTCHYTWLLEHSFNPTCFQ
jgi:hypothetical protein